MKNTFTPKSLFCFIILKVFVLLFLETSKAQVVLTRHMDNYTQDFNSLPVSESSTWANGTFYIPGWTIHRTSTTTSLLIGTGSSNAGGLYSFGVSGSGDRALGAISSGSASVGQFAWGLLILNNTGLAITALNVNFVGEQWRSASRTAGSQATTFWYSQSSLNPSFNLSPLSDNNWTNVPELDFYSLVNFSAAGALNGNMPANKSFLASTILIDIPDGYYIMLRWKDLNDLDDDHGLAIDDFSLTWSFTEMKDPVIMPVELMFLKSVLEAKAIRLEWATASEGNSSHFEVERSTNGLAFEKIGLVLSNNFSSQKINYSFLDDQPLTGTSYYRLRQVDLDGAFAYSKHITVRRSGPVAFKLHSNLVTNDLHFELPPSATATQLLIYNKLGKLAFSDAIRVKTTDLHININHLQSGYYFVVLQDEIGQRHVLKFMKK